jgi:hypothetical protein
MFGMHVSDLVVLAICRLTRQRAPEEELDGN